MNVDDIIRKLQCCGNQMYSCTDKRCKAKTLGDAVDLINFLRAEIERLNHIRAEQSKEIDRLKTEMSYMKSPSTIGDTHEMGTW